MLEQQIKGGTRFDWSQNQPTTPARGKKEGKIIALFTERNLISDAKPLELGTVSPFSLSFAGDCKLRNFVLQSLWNNPKALMGILIFGVEPCAVHQESERVSCKCVPNLGILIW